MSDTILVVDDQPDLLLGLERTLSMEFGCRVLTAEGGPRALEVLEKEPVDVVLADICMPGMDGIELLKRIKEADSSITVIIMTAYGTIETAVQAIREGAFDFIQKPLDEDRLIHLLKNGLEYNRLVRENNRLMERLCEKAPFENMIGSSPPMQKVFQTIQMLARTDVTVLVRGETGTGKDMAARAVHGLSARKNARMVTVNCPALPETILESELFGHRKGAFTSANQDKKGLFDQAHGSTIFLDEIGDLSLPVQTKLLRVLEDKQVMPLGDSQSHEVDVRIITATNQNLEEKIQKREFREDLYYRLNVASLHMPPLADIRQDIPLLADHFVKKIACENNAEPKVLAPEVMDYLLNRNWPGNIRELENTIRGWCALTADSIITLAHTGKTPESRVQTPDVRQVDVTRPYKDLKAEIIDSFTLDYLCRLLAHTSGNISLSAQISGIKRQSLQKIIKRYNVSVDQYRS